MYCAPILKYLNYCVELWGNNYKSSLHSLIILQKKAIRIIHKVGYQDHTNTLFLKSKLLKFMDPVNLQTALITFKAKNKPLPANVQRVFCDRDGGHYIRANFNFKIHGVRTNMRSFCISICGVILWNTLKSELKQCSSMYQFKKMYKE